MFLTGRKGANVNKHVFSRTGNEIKRYLYFAEQYTGSLLLNQPLCGLFDSHDSCFCSSSISQTPQHHIQTASDVPGPYPQSISRVWVLIILCVLLPIAGKKKGGGVCFMINYTWCDCDNIKELKSFCSPDLEYLTTKCRPYFLPRELSSVIVTAVYIPPVTPVQCAFTGDYRPF